MKLKDFDFRIWDNKYKEYIFTNRTISKYYEDASKVCSLAGRIRKEKYSGNLVFDDLGCDCEEREIELFTWFRDKNGINRSMFIEQAILEYSSKKPKIEFFFHGITKTRRTNKLKQQDKNSEENNLQSKISKESNAQANVNESRNDNKIQKKSGGMMFNFGSKE
ncbi:Uncharacterised protein [Campylobacter jejuni subsp. doylei]|nr:Uncharacterised protein [Campylobacter jejuni subsp. doylei]